MFYQRKEAEQYELDKVDAQKENSNVIVLQMHYAENYTCRAQDEVQPAHWNQAQVTLTLRGSETRSFHMSL